MNLLSEEQILMMAATFAEEAFGDSSTLCSEFVSFARSVETAAIEAYKTKQDSIDNKCKCSLSISLLGEGCRYCQPQEYIDRLHEQIEDDQQAVPDGWKLVPLEPTSAMFCAARDWSIKVNGIGVGDSQSLGCYTAMISAAPSFDRCPSHESEGE